jgi:hypothetical protein
MTALSSLGRSSCETVGLGWRWDRSPDASSQRSTLAVPRNCSGKSQRSPKPPSTRVGSLASPMECLHDLASSAKRDFGTGCAKSLDGGNHGAYVSRILSIRSGSSASTTFSTEGR